MLAIAGILISLTSTGLAESERVSREGTQLQYKGETFRRGGANAYWLGLDENEGGVEYPTKFRIDDAL